MMNFFTNTSLKEGATIAQAQKRFAQMFTAMICLLFLFVGAIFLGIKYESLLQADKHAFRTTLTKIIQHSSSIEAVHEQMGEASMKMPQKDKNLPPPIVPVSFFIFNAQDEIIAKRVFLHHTPPIQKNYPPAKVVIEKEMLVYQDQIRDGGRVMFFKPMMYSSHDLLRDVGMLLGALCISSIFFYVLSLWLAKKVLAPVEQNIKDMQVFIHNAGHELKTPLTVAHSFLGLLEATDESQKQYIQEAKNALIVSSNQINALLELASIDGVLPKENILLHQCLEDVHGLFTQAIEEKQIHYHCNTQEEVILQASQTHVMILLQNLFSNAIKYNVQQGNMQVTLTKEYLSLQNQGATLSKDQGENMFERFVRYGDANTTGQGIGLAIVKKITQVYGWKILYQVTPQGWNEIVLYWK